ncbi:hypothetical protein [uncultured Photobacterium sp.]|uniref:hypothetical protein n=1 Tax=uncultured Photobacterium sp. TaxID=173973 RepID=UPI00260BFB33|nr:hypothetical protein [uncultured Photobacterium sp.]
MTVLNKKNRQLAILSYFKLQVFTHHCPYSAQNVSPINRVSYHLQATTKIVVNACHAIGIQLTDISTTYLLLLV